MQETLKINIPEGFQVASFNDKTGEITFKETPKDVKERIKTVADILADNKLTQDDFDNQNKGLSEDEVAYRLIKLLAKSLNEGWTPDWNDSSEYKYFPWFDMEVDANNTSGFRSYGYDHWSAYSCVGSRLCFISAELAKYAGEQFTEVYKKFMIIK